MTLAEPISGSGPEAQAAARRELDLASRSELEKQVTVYAYGTEVATAIAAVEAAKRLGRGLHTVVEVSRALSPRGCAQSLGAAVRNRVLVPAAPPS
jgi:hypothetical protein